jgi:UDP-N-acetylmuramate dehydrogenase
MTLDVHHRVSLRSLNTFRVDATAAVMAEVRRADDLPFLFAAIGDAGVPWLALGEGSNVLFVDDVPGVVVRPLIAGVDVVEDRGDRVRIRVGAGENWHALVEWTLGQGFTGLENLALIPGTVGAAPVQNIGAYGVEIDRCIAAVEAFDIDAGTIRRLGPEECGFGYRDSRFKREPGRWLISAVEFELYRGSRPQVGYAGLADELAAQGVDSPDAQAVFEAVCALRRRKLPDPARIGNAGSFFKNPAVPDAQAAFIRDHWPTMPSWPSGAGHVKLSAAWLLERAGLKGHRLGDAGVSDHHALVLVNHGSATGRQLLELSRHIQHAVEAQFGVRLEPEPRILVFT